MPSISRTSSPSRVATSASIPATIGNTKTVLKSVGAGGLAAALMKKHAATAKVDSNTNVQSNTAIDTTTTTITPTIISKVPVSVTVPAPTRLNVSAPKCTICTKSVYKAEEFFVMNQTFHKGCFKCGGKFIGIHAGCGKILTLHDYAEHLSNPFCRTCFNRVQNQETLEIKENTRRKSLAATSTCSVSTSAPTTSTSTPSITTTSTPTCVSPSVSSDVSHDTIIDALALSTKTQISSNNSPHLLKDTAGSAPITDTTVTLNELIAAAIEESVELPISLVGDLSRRVRQTISPRWDELDVGALGGDVKSDSPSVDDAESEPTTSTKKELQPKTNSVLSDADYESTWKNSE